ncbi:MAG: hypothetical protein CK528_12275 [Alcaligenaceae bacterium]|nr:MAG: hypothetical protein CK528_12275 [Alcaligenaceae bacterium]
MDQSVLEAQIRWPDVPAAYGWLSLSARGEWRLHPMGDAQQGAAGQGISNIQILSFIGRNYSAEPSGTWFFQNGPQRVYVRLDAAPFVLRADPTLGALSTHNGLTIHEVTAWWLSDNGQLYAQTELGAARVDDRDLSVLANTLSTLDSRNLLTVLEQTEPLLFSQLDLSLYDPKQVFSALKKAAPLRVAAQQDLPKTLHFVANPSMPLTH